jgi:hypothetical protein
MISKASVGSIQRALLVLEQQGAEQFLRRTGAEDHRHHAHRPATAAAISVLAADKLMMNPRLYATFLLWLLSELFEDTARVGDPDKPKLVFFFDEAHLLFNDAPKVLLERVEQVVRLIRSKGVGVYFVTQNPLDVPETVLAQLGNRVQHALRAYTPREQKAVKTAADTFRPNPAFDCATVITNSAPARRWSRRWRQGCAVDGRAHADPPAVRPRRAADRCGAPAGDGQEPGGGVYDEDLDRESAFEILAVRAKKASDSDAAKQAQPTEPTEGSASGRWTLPGFGDDDKDEKSAQGRTKSAGYQRETVIEAAMKSVARTVATQVGRALVRGILGSLKR